MLCLSRRLGRIPALIVALPALACSRPSAPDATPTPAPVSTPAPSSTPTPTPGASASAARRPAPGVPPHPADDAGTRSRIACGTGSCRAPDEACMETPDGPRCVEPDEIGRRDSVLGLACDDGSDCTEGRTCCAASEVTRHRRTRCIEPDVADGEACIMQACVEGAGAPCPKAQACRDGFCRPQIPPRASCLAGGARCPADRPVCTFAAGRGTCIARAAQPTSLSPVAVAPTASYLECTKRSDCGAGMTCCAIRDGAIGDEILETECRRTCGTPPLPEAVCETSADCPEGLVTGVAGGMRRRTCRKRAASPAQPSWIGQCRYVGDP